MITRLLVMMGDELPSGEGVSHARISLGIIGGKECASEIPAPFSPRNRGHAAALLLERALRNASRSMLASMRGSFMLIQLVEEQRLGLISPLQKAAVSTNRSACALAAHWC